MEYKKDNMVSFVVLAYNRCAEVLITISKLKEFAPTLPFPTEIIVVDNESADDTGKQISKQHPDVKLITKTKNNGIAGWNAGFSAVRYKYMLVLDDDSHPEAGISEAVEYLQQNPDTGILALNITAGPYLTDEWAWKKGRPWLDGEEILGFFGCGAIIRKEVYEKIGGFGEWMLVYGHEWDYGIRCIDAGYKVRYFKNSSINHRASPVNRSLKRARIFGTRNDMAIVYKYFGENRWKYIIRMFLNNIKRIRYEGWLTVWYDILGSVEFLKFKNTLSITPVKKETQIFFADNYMNTQPVFNFITKRLKRNSDVNL